MFINVTYRPEIVNRESLFAETTCRHSTPSVVRFLEILKPKNNNKTERKSDICIAFLQSDTHAVMSGFGQSAFFFFVVVSELLIICDGADSWLLDRFCAWISFKYEDKNTHSFQEDIQRAALCSHEVKWPKKMSNKLIKRAGQWDLSVPF